MSSVAGVTRQQIAEIAALIDTNRVQLATELIQALIRDLPSDLLVLISPDLNEQISKLMPKRRRDLAVALESALSGQTRARSIAAGTGRTPKPGVVEPQWPTRVTQYADRLTNLRDHHIFQWATFYRENVLFVFKDLLSGLRSTDHWQPVLESVSKVFAQHANDIFEQGAYYLADRGISADVAEIKSVNGLQRFLYLVISLVLEQRDGIRSSKEARLAWDISSSLLVGILRGYGRLECEGLTGWDLLRRNIRAWLPALGFARGSDALVLLDEFPRIYRLDDIFVTVVPALLGVEKLGNRFHNADFVFPRLSRVAIGDPPRLDITLSIAESGSTRDLIVSCFFDAFTTEERVLGEAVALRATAIVARLHGSAKAWVESHANGRVLDAAEVRPVPEQAQNFSEMVRAVLEENSSADAAGTDPTLLRRNYARDFPLEDPDFRRLFMVERHSVKQLLEELENGVGVHLWCSVRRSGKTTAASNLSDMTGRSAVSVQTMDHQPTQIEQNLLERRVREAFDSHKAIPTDFFARLVDECVLSNAPVDLKSRKIVLIIDEYESLFGLIAAYTNSDVGLRYLVAQPLMSQMVGFATRNLLILMGQRPDAHLILSSQNQLSPLVRQNNFPLFEHFGGATDTEFTQFLRRVLTEKLPFAPSFADAVYEETSGHPYLTVNLMVDLCDWLIANHAREGQADLDASTFASFSKDRLTQAALQRSPHYAFFHGMLAEYLSELGRQNEPWLYAVSSVLQEIARKHPKAFTCSLASFQQMAAPFGAAVRMTPDRLLASAAMSNFLRDHAGQVSPGIRLMARLAASAVPKVN